MLWAMLTMSCAMYAQTWTWTHEFTMKSSPNPVYFYNEGQKFFLKATSTYATNANEATAFKVEYKRESSQDRYYISYEDGGTQYVNQNNGNQNWGTTNYGWYFDTNGSGITIRTRDALDSNKRSIAGYNGGINYPKNDKSTNATWYVISPAQMSNYNRYMEVYQAAQAAGVDVSLYSSASNSNAATVIANIEDAIKEKFSSATIDNHINATGLIKNVGYEFKTWDYGWTSTNFVDQTGGGVAKFSGAHIAEMYCNPNNGEVASSGSIEQTINNLPAGFYLLKAKATGGVGGDNLYAKVGSKTFSTPVPNTNDNVYTYTVAFTVESTSDVTIGFARENSTWWSAVDDFELLYLGSETPSTTVNGKNFIVIKGTSKHVSRGGEWATQAIFDNYGVPVIVENNNGLAYFHFLDNAAYLGTDRAEADVNLLFTDRQADGTRRQYIIISGEGEHDGEYQIYNFNNNKYLANENDKLVEKAEGDWFTFESIETDYEIHLAGIKDMEAQRVAERAGITVRNRDEYNAIIEELEAGDVTTVFPSNSEQETLAATYFEKKNEELAAAQAPEGTPRDLVGGDKVQLTLDKGLYAISCDAFQQAMSLDRLLENHGFRGLTYMYVKANGNYIAKDQLKSITETTTNDYPLPTDAETAEAALDANQYFNRILFYIDADNTPVEFGIENPQRLGNGIDANAGSWVAFKNIKVESFGDLSQATLSVKAEKYGTFVAAFDVVLPEGLIAYSAQLNGDMTSVSLTKVAEGGKTLPGKTPVILKNTTGNLIEATFTGSDDTDDAETVKVGSIVGFYKQGVTVPNDGKSYVLQTQGGVQAFYKVTSAFTGTKNRCYVIDPTQGAASRLSIVFGEATDINNVQFNVINNDAVRYNLNGQRVNANAKGIVIVNGKKVVLR